MAPAPATFHHSPATSNLVDSPWAKLGLAKAINLHFSSMDGNVIK